MDEIADPMAQTIGKQTIGKEDWKPDSERLAYLRNSLEAVALRPEPRNGEEPPAKRALRSMDLAVRRLESILGYLEERTAAFRRPGGPTEPPSGDPIPAGSPLVQALSENAWRIGRAVDRIGVILDTLEA
jgi:hypothetical protein